MTRFTAYFDGACGPTNPGERVSYGIVIWDGLTPVHREGRAFKYKEGTNNVAEYMGLLAVLEWLKKNGYTHESTIIYGDSKLVVHQMNDRWRIKDGAYVRFARKSRRLLQKFPAVRVRWIPRGKNLSADKLSKKALNDKGIKEFYWS